MEIQVFSPSDPRTRAFRSALNSRAVQMTTAALFAALPLRSRLYLVGGYLRKTARHILYGADEPPTDLDFIVDCSEKLALSSELLGGRVAYNTFGGFRWYPENMTTYVDVWRLSDQYHIRYLNRPATIPEALRGFPFNLERAALDVAEQQVYEGGCLSGLAERIIRYDAQDKYLPHVQAVRAILLRRKTSFRFHSTVLDLLATRPWRGNEDDITTSLLANGHDLSTVEGVLKELQHIAAADDAAM